MREIKFRGKCLYPDARYGVRWLYGGYAEIDGDGFIFPEGKFHYGHGDYWADEDSFDIPIVDKSTVGQYTGLKDKNGREIYEGDVVETVFPYKYGIVFFNGAFQRLLPNKKEYYPLSKGWEDSICVIGNIHDNPELLKIH